MIIYLKSFLVKVKPRAMAVEICVAINPKPLTDSVTEVEVVVFLPKLPTVFNVVDETS